jgi:hypothetical protein
LSQREKHITETVVATDPVRVPTTGDGVVPEGIAGTATGKTWGLTGATRNRNTQAVLERQAEMEAMEVQT